MSTLAVRDLIPVRGKDLEQCLLTAQVVFKQWVQDWLPADAGWQPDLAASCCTESAMDAQALELTSDPYAVRSRLADLLVGRERGQALSESDWAVQSAAAALNDLNARMQAQTHRMCVASADADLRQLSGVVLVRERRLGLAWMWQSPATVAAQPGTVDDITRCVQAQRVQLVAGLGEVEIAVSDLLALQTGDVIRFPASLKSPVPLSIRAGDQLKQAPLSAQLGARQGHVAIKLHPHQS